MEAQPALVGTDRAVELDAVTGVDLNPALVIHPRNLKDDGAFRNDHALENLVLLVFRLGLEHLREGAEHFGYALQKLLFMAVGLLQPGQHAIDIIAHFCKTFHSFGSAL